MPGIVTLVDQISLDVTRGLVAAGYGLGFDPGVLDGSNRRGQRFTRTGNPSALAIIGASNTTPIVLTTAYPHGIAPLRADGYPNVLHAVVSGVGGNAAANVTITDPRSLITGQPAGVALTPTDATHFSMQAVDYTTGALADVAGSGVYTSGGVIVPALTEGRIVLGRERVKFEQTAPPWIGMVITGARFSGRSVAHGAKSLSSELKAEVGSRSIATETLVFEVHSWGAAIPDDPAYSFDACQVIYQQVIQSVHLLTWGAYELLTGSWEDQKASATQLIKMGHYEVFGLAVRTPVLDTAQAFVAPPIVIAPTTYMSLPDGSPVEMGCSG